MKQAPIIVYVGDRERGEALRERVAAHGWHVLVPEETFEALAMHVFHYPDLYVLVGDPACSIVAEVYFHLASIGTGPMLLLIDDLCDVVWANQAGAGVHRLRLDISDDGLISEMRALLEGREPSPRSSKVSEGI